MKNHINVNDAVDFFLYKSTLDNNANFSITPLKLQKLLYYAQAWNLAIKNRTLFDCKFQAWTHGPVIVNIYHQFKQYGYNQIRKNVCSIPESIKNNKEVLNVLNNVWDVYGKYNGKQLEILTHAEDPWKKARGQISPLEPSKEEIDENIMKEYYKKFI